MDTSGWANGAHPNPPRRRCLREVLILCDIGLEPVVLGFEAWGSGPHRCPRALFVIPTMLHVLQGPSIYMDPSPSPHVRVFVSLLPPTSQQFLFPLPPPPPAQSRPSRHRGRHGRPPNREPSRSQGRSVAAGRRALRWSTRVVGRTHDMKKRCWSRGTGKPATSPAKETDTNRLTGNYPTEPTALGVSSPAD